MKPQQSVVRSCRKSAINIETEPCQHDVHSSSPNRSVPVLNKQNQERSNLFDKKACANSFSSNESDLFWSSAASTAGMTDAQISTKTLMVCIECFRA